MREVVEAGLALGQVIVWRAPHLHFSWTVDLVGVAVNCECIHGLYIYIWTVYKLALLQGSVLAYPIIPVVVLSERSYMVTLYWSLMSTI